NIYDYPANVFVAEFIGNPPMNVFSATVARDDGLLLVNGSLRLRVPATLEAALAPHLGQELPVGIRPEHVTVRPGWSEDAAAGGTFHAIVEVVEPLGSEQIVHVRVDGALLVARVEPHLRIAV